MKKIKSATLDVLNATEVDVEATFTKGLPSFSIVGLVSTVIQESKDRIKSALIMNDFKFPPKKITINLSPSDITKSGTHFDLSIALLIALYETKVVFEDFFIFGELGLDGQLKDTKNIFPLILSLAQKNKNLKILAPTQSNKTLSLIPNIKLYTVNTFIEAINFFMQEDKSDFFVKNSEIKSSKINVLNHDYFYSSNYLLDFSDVKGQKVAKRAALISASGNHNILFEGSPGSGKSMISKRLQYIQSPMSINDILHKAKMDCLDLKEVDFEPRRVFRSPHNSSTKASIFGGGTSQSKIGEIALCHGGILFFDEFPHFQKSVIEALREPLEDYQILISRVNSKIRYETKFLFVAAQNPCPCGNLQNTLKECRCTDLEVKRYKSRISEPILDRIDLFVSMTETNIHDKSDISSIELHKKVIEVFKVQVLRGQKELNGKLSDQDIKKYCKLSDEVQHILNQASQRFFLSFRAINKVLKVSRTIADLEQSNEIKKEHLLEALSYRRR